MRGTRGGVRGRGGLGAGAWGRTTRGRLDPEAGRHRRVDTDELARTGLVRTKRRPGAALGRDRGPRPQVCETLLRPDHSFEGRTHPLLGPPPAPLPAPLPEPGRAVSGSPSRSPLPHSRTTPPTTPRHFPHTPVPISSRHGHNPGQSASDPIVSLHLQD
ncbi:hypothetical protein KPATCC21470_6816 [Kitasatospora purpeofusca]